MTDEIDDVQASADSFDERVSRLDEVGLAALLQHAAEALDRYETADAERSAVDAALDLIALLAPLDLGLRSEPQENLKEALVIASSVAPETLRLALDRAVEAATDARRWAALLRLLSAVADAGLGVGDALAFRVLTRSEWLADRVEVLKEAGATLTALAGCRSGVAAVSMFERLDRLGAGSSEALTAALQAVATHDPARLEAVVSSYRVMLAKVADETKPKELRPLFRDLARRAGPLTFLGVLGGLPLEDNLVLFRAAFGGGRDAPFKLVPSEETSDGDQTVRIEFGGALFDTAALGALTAREGGLLKMRSRLEISYFYVHPDAMAERLSVPGWFQVPEDQGAERAADDLVTDLLIDRLNQSTPEA